MSNPMSFSNLKMEKSKSFQAKSMKKSKLAGSLILLIVLLLGSLIMIIPFLWMLLTSFDWGARLNIPFPPRFWPKDFSTRTYELAFKNIPMLKYMINSMVISIGVIFVSMLSALLSGYAISKLKFKGSMIVLVLAFEHNDDSF